MTTPNDKKIEAFAARLQEGVRERAAVFGPRPLPARVETEASKTEAERKKQVREQRSRLQAASRRRFTARQSRLPRPRQNRIGSAAARGDARALSRLRRSNGWLW
ncbi:hypothetical protein [Streptomyces sp. NPDC059909]|uniref:hypothetical protein n=1 Tax=Streptomyces sp. NPDC059909 TaxID=3346998 RepID=UPI00365A29A7